MDEREVLARVRAIFDQQPTISSLIVGNGDDGAVFSSGGNLTVIATDMAVEDIHFRLDWSAADQIGRKITAANLADICAMGGWPEYLLVSVAFPERFIPNLELLAEGIFEEARKTGASVIGGDLSKSDRLVISITAVGSTTRPIKRSGAVAGDSLVISHLPGWSNAGLDLLTMKVEASSSLHAQALDQHRAPQIDYIKYSNAFENLSSATDISDGLIIDATHLASAGNVSIHIDSSKFSDCQDFVKLTELASSLGKDSLSWILTGGEDHVLLATTAAPEKCEGFTVIGRIDSGEGVFIDGTEVREEDLAHRAGYQHNW